MKCMIDNKVIEINDKYVPFLKKQLYEMDNGDLKYFLRSALTTGDLRTGLKCPNLEKYIIEHSSEELSKIIEDSIEMDMKVMA